MFVCAVAFVCIFLYYLNFRYKRRFLYEAAKKLPGVGALPIIGHTHWFLGGPEKIYLNIKKLAQLINENGGQTKLWIGPNFYFVTFDLDDIQTILETCLKKDYSYKFLKDWLGNGLFVAKVEQWKMKRKLLLPIFHNKLLEDFIVVFGEQSTVLVKRLEDEVGKQPFDIYPYITSCLLDIVFETAMGERMDVQHNPDTPYLRARHIVMSIISMRIFKAWLQPDILFNASPYSKVYRESIDFTHKFTDEVVSKKRHLYEKFGHSDKERKDMLELLLEKRKFSNQELREDIDSITIAGNDTTALVISYALLLLGSHPEEQGKAYNEIHSILGDSNRWPTKEDLSKMEYLERVLKETMRLYTVVPILGRETTEEVKLSKYTLPPGTGCAILPFTIHRSKKIWGPDADDFNPDRFLPENSVNRHPCAFLAFSHGSRNCIGRHFGWLVMKSILASFLRRFTIKADLSVCDRMKIEILLFPVAGHLVTLEKRVK